MASRSTPWDSERMLELATRHARVESQRRLDDLMETLVAEPVYEFVAQGLMLRGGPRASASAASGSTRATTSCG